MTEYKCGHKSETILLDSNFLSVAAYLEWKDSVGWNGDKSQCFACYCKQMEQEEVEREI
jgi:hypothetical protein